MCVCVRAHPTGPAGPVLHGSVLRGAHQASGAVSAAVLGAVLQGVRAAAEG